MQAVIYGFGESDYILTTLSAIAIIVKHFKGDIVSLFAFVGLSYVTLQSIMSGSRTLVQDQGKFITKYLVVTSLLMFTTTRIFVDDEISGVKRHVDNVPIGLALPATTFSLFGYSLTRVYESVFSDHDDLEYSSYGLVFASQIMADARNTGIINRKLLQNVDNYIAQCVIDDSVLGWKYSVTDLIQSDDIWSVMSKEPSKIHGFEYAQGHNTKFMKCDAAAKAVEADFKQDDTVPRIFRLKGRDHNRDINKSFKNSLEFSHRRFFGEQSKNATDILRQQMLINSYKTYGRHSYAALRALGQQKATWMTTGELAKNSLPIMRGIFLCLLYSAFPFVILLALLPGGVKVMMRYLGMMMWLQLWPPFYAVLHMFMTKYGAWQTGDYTGFTGANLVELTDMHSNIAAMAGYFAMAIPYLSYILIQGGAGAFVHLAGSMTSATQSAAGNVAGEVKSGNMSYGNVSYGNMQSMQQTTGLNYNDTSSFRSGSIAMQNTDGSVLTQHADGHTQIQAGAGINTSTGTVGLIAKNQIAKSVMHGATKLASETASIGDQLTESRGKLMENSASVIENIVGSEGFSTNTNFGASNSTLKSLARIRGLSKHVKNSTQFSGQSNAKLTAAISIGTPWEQFKASIGASGEMSNMTQEEYTKLQDYANVNNLTTSVDDVVRFSQDKAVQDNFNVSKTAGNNLQESFRENRELASTYAQKKDALDQWNRAEQYTKTDDFMQSKDMYQPFQNYLESQGMSPGKAHKMIEDGKANEYLDAFTAHLVEKGDLVGRVDSNINRVDAVANSASGKIANTELSNNFDTVDAASKGLKDKVDLVADQRIELEDMVQEQADTNKAMIKKQEQMLDARKQDMTKKYKSGKDRNFANKTVNTGIKKAKELFGDKNE